MSQEFLFNELESSYGIYGAGDNYSDLSVSETSLVFKKMSKYRASKFAPMNKSRTGKHVIPRRAAATKRRKNVTLSDILHHVYSDEEASIQSQLSEPKADGEESFRNSLIAAYFYLETRKHMGKASKYFQTLLRQAEDDTLGLSPQLKSTMYYWYSRFKLVQYFDSKDPTCLATAEHILKRQVESGEGCISHCQLLLADILVSMHHDYEGAHELYESALKLGSNDPSLVINSWRLSSRLAGHGV
jgi:hypothetical protein